MIFHTIRTITIGEFAEMVEYNDVRKVRRLKIPLPKKMILRAYKRILLEYNQIANADKINSEIAENSHKLKHLVQINICYKIMLDMLNITAKYGNVKGKESEKGSRDILIDMYSRVYNREPKTAADYERVFKDVDLKIRRFKQRFIEADDDEGVDFEKLIMNIEIILAPMQIRDKKLYTLPRLIEMASKKIKANGRN